MSGVAVGELAQRDVHGDVDDAPGPGLPVEAMWNASWTIRGSSAGSLTRYECLTIGSVMPVMSASWKASVPMRSLRTCPVMATSGDESR